MAFETQLKFRLYHSRNFFFQRDYAELAQLHLIATAERPVKLSHCRVMLEAYHDIRELVYTTFAGLIRAGETTV